jgi:hypothetical protein
MGGAGPCQGRRRHTASYDIKKCNNAPKKIKAMLNARSLIAPPEPPLRNAFSSWRLGDIHKLLLLFIATNIIFIIHHATSCLLMYEESARFVHISKDRPFTASCAPSGAEEQRVSLLPLTMRHGDDSLSWRGVVASHARTLPMALGYTVCSSMLLVTNKLAIQAWPYPSLLMAVQFLVSAGVVRGLSVMGRLDVEPLVWDKVRASWIPHCTPSRATSARAHRALYATPPNALLTPTRPQVKAFWMVPFFFELAIFASIKLLEESSVETAIVFRTTVPLITSWADWAFMGREAPSTKSATSLVVIVLGALVYARRCVAINIGTWKRSAWVSQNIRFHIPTLEQVCDVAGAERLCQKVRRPKYRNVKEFCIGPIAGSSTRRPYMLSTNSRPPHFSNRLRSRLLSPYWRGRCPGAGIFIERTYF